MFAIEGMQKSYIYKISWPWPCGFPREACCCLIKVLRMLFSDGLQFSNKYSYFTFTSPNEMFLGHD